MSPDTPNPSQADPKTKSKWPYALLLLLLLFLLGFGISSAATGTNTFKNALKAIGLQGPAGPDGQAGSNDCTNGICVSRQASSPGDQESGNINLTGTIIANSIRVSEASITDLLAGSINANTITTNSLTTDNTNSNSTTSNTTTTNNLTANSISTNTISATSLSGNGAGITDLNASFLASGTVADARLSSSVTVQGNTFNGALQLVQTTAAGLLPTLSGINLTNLNASAVSTGTLNVAYGGTGVDGSTAPNGSLLIGNGSGYSLNTITAGAGISVTNGAGSITIANTGAAVACNITSNYVCNGGNTLGATLTIGTNDANSLVFETNNQTAQTIASGGAVTFQNATDTTSGFRVMDADGGTPIFNVDTTNERVGIGTATPAFTLDVAGDLRLTGSLGTIYTSSQGNNLNFTRAGANYIAALDAAGSLQLGVLSNSGVIRLASDGTAYINQSVNNNTNINTGTSTGLVTIGGGLGNFALDTTNIDISSAGAVSGVTTLGTTGIITAGAVGTADNSTYLCRNSSNQIATCNSSGAGVAFVQGGNSFGSTAVLGTNDAYDLQFETGGTSKVTILNSNGNVGIGDTTPDFKLELEGTSSVTDRKIGINDTQVVYLPDQAVFVGSLFYGNGGQNLSHSAGADGYYNTGLGIYALNNNTTGYFNTATGYATLVANTTGYSNTATGFNSLQANTTGVGNTANGASSLVFNTIGSNNTATGASALYTNTTGFNNTSNGFQALYSNTTGSSNTAMGQGALRQNTTAASNSAFGNDALFFNSTGQLNVAVGADALQENTTGSYNTATGAGALYSNTTGNLNTAIGYQTLFSNTTGSYNTSNGYQALYNNGKTVTAGTFVVGVSYTIQSTGTTDFTLIGAADSNVGTVFTATGVGTGTGTASSNTNYNTAVGYQALYSNITGIQNLATGQQALYSNITGSYNSASGFQALYSNTTGSYNIATGFQALFYNTTGEQNTASGFQALFSNTTGSTNVATGVGALFANTTGSNNTALGTYSLNSNTTGAQNTASGVHALSFNTTGNYNTASGYNALYSNTTASANTATGVQALFANTTGYYNTATGFQSLYSNTTGNYNTAIGNYTLFEQTTGSGNTALGYNTGRGITTGNYNTIIGSNVTGLAAGLSNNIIIADGQGNQRINVNSSGNVSIGSNAPAFNKLLVTTAGTDDGTGAGYFENTGAGVTEYGLTAYVSGSSSFSNRAIYASATGSGGTNYAIYSAAGENYFAESVGIGDTTPDAKLDVTQTGEGTTVKIKDSDGECDLDPDAATLVITCSSDERLKTNIVSAASVLSQINGLQIRDYTIAASGNTATGVIAQELLTTNPDMVHQGEDGYFKVDSYNPWKVIKGIQELSSNIDTLNTNFTEAISKTNGDIKATNELLATQGLSLESISTELQALADRVSEQEAKNVSQDAKIEQLEAEIQQLKNSN